jgi:hypothetical protein
MEWNYKKVKKFGINTPIFFVANYFLVSLIINIFLGGNPKQVFLPIFLLIATFLITLFFSTNNPTNISHKRILSLVDFIFFLNIIFFITGKVNAEGHLFKTFEEKLGFNLKILLVIFAFALFLIKLYYRKFNLISLNFIFTAVLFLPILLLIPTLYPTPFIDVFFILKQGIIDLSQNTDPYLRIFPDIYKGLYDYSYQQQEVRLVYWPMNLYLLYPFQYIFGDLRFAFPFFLLLTCLILYLGNQKNKSIFYISFILIFSNPYTVYMVKYAWIDTLALPFFAMYFEFFKRKKYVISFLIVGILMSLKLYYIFLLPMSVLYLFNINNSWKKSLPFGALSFCTAAFCFLPYLITNPKAILYTIEYFIQSLPRFDSLSISGYLYQFGLNINGLSSLISVLVLIFILFRIYLKKRTSLLFQIQDFTLILFALFLFGKQAFGNYYYNLILLAIIYLSILMTEKNQTVEQKLETE